MVVMISIPKSDRYWLKNAHIPCCLLEVSQPDWLSQQTREGLILMDVEIASGKISQLRPAGNREVADIPWVDLRGGQLWPCFVDLHTHLDKGHIWQRSPNPDGTFTGALNTAISDSEKYWSAEDIYQRMEFGLKCSYAHGTQALRTHLDSAGKLTEISWEVFNSLRKKWCDRIFLQAVSLVSLDYYLTPQGEKLADRVAEMGGILGGVAYINRDLDQQIKRVFDLAKDRNLSLDFHVDENGDPDSNTLYKIAEYAVKSQFENPIICGHCCSLSVQNPEVINQTINLLKASNIGIVSLPMCNLYLQDRQYDNHSHTPQTPKWRGVTLLHELKQAGIPVTVASDNCRDPFYAFGDHDVLEVFKMSVRIGHLDHPYGDWPQIVTKTAADLMGLSNRVRLGVGISANLIAFKGRNFSELLSRSQHDRVIIRNGASVSASIPDYSELDNLITSHFRE
ncbi:putative cytosine deaminase [Limnospira platensis NIES-39]|uniref:Cytosine deaminase n=2 Tax=Sirenicapillariaceae TaxID=2934961 RepID=A0A5M3T7L5_LIMPL|nr:putative cytosine deaminase [Arthrospira platensis NIES-39]BDT11740.1 putative cytosine deaminase [Arthrospira platensis NIES-39]GCE93900.1 putative cytosine deaminase [Arthrospira platensis NIES-46]